MTTKNIVIRQYTMDELAKMQQIFDRDKHSDHNIFQLALVKKVQEFMVRQIEMRPMDTVFDSYIAKEIIAMDADNFKHATSWLLHDEIFVETLMNRLNDRNLPQVSDNYATRVNILEQVNLGFSLHSLDIFSKSAVLLQRETPNYRLTSTSSSILATIYKGNTLKMLADQLLVKNKISRPLVSNLCSLEPCHILDLPDEWFTMHNINVPADISRSSYLATSIANYCAGYSKPTVDELKSSPYVKELSKSLGVSL